MSPSNGERRPGRGSGAETPAKKSASSMTQGGHVERLRSRTGTPDLAARARRHDHGVLVLAERRDGVVVSQVFADLPAAERKVARTRARGLSASLTLVRLLPVLVLPDELDTAGDAP